MALAPSGRRRPHAIARQGPHIGAEPGARHAAPPPRAFRYTQQNEGRIGRRRTAFGSRGRGEARAAQAALRKGGRAAGRALGGGARGQGGEGGTNPKGGAKGESGIITKFLPPPPPPCLISYANVQNYNGPYGRGLRATRTTADTHERRPRVLTLANVTTNPCLMWPHYILYVIKLRTQILWSLRPL